MLELMKSDYLEVIAPYLIPISKSRIELNLEINRPGKPKNTAGKKERVNIQIKF